MALLKIRTDGDPILRCKSRPIKEVDNHIKTLAKDMIETMRHANGCGLAGPQIGVLRRIVVIEVEEGHPYVLINPVITKTEGCQEEAEGCLSLPNRWGITRRPMNVTVHAINENGDEYDLEGTDLLARAICHEVDHLDGKLFTDVMVREVSVKDVEA